MAPFFRLLVAMGCYGVLATFRLSAGGLNQHDVLPIMWRHCSPCHGSQQHEGELSLITRGAMLRGGKSGPAIIPGKADESRLIARIKQGECPPSKRLVEANVKPVEAAALKRLQEWIDDGAPESPDLPEVAGTVEDPLVKEADREFWAFQSPKAAVPPHVRSPQLVRNSIDAFLLSKLEEKGLTFSAEASRRVLIRRLYLDLLGLPPSPHEVEAYLNDNRPDAWSRVVEKLLASPQYGERWGRMWLDVAGYADVEGKREQHLPRPAAYRYRDYVIQAFNSDKPYDRFLLEQIAGDELADAEHAPRITPEIYDNLVATGFLRMAPDPTWANITGFVPDRLDVMADAIDVFGSGVLGLSLKCARCHNHKFDPIPQRDYFRLVDLFKGALDEYNWLKPGLEPFGGAANTGKLGERSLPYVTTEEREPWQKQTGLQKQKLAPPKIAALWDRGEPSPTYIYRRGEYERPGALVKGGVPAVLLRAGEKLEIAPPWPGARKTGRRLALARWLTRRDNPLTSRVIVNRIWKEHFGQGLVATPGNFGKMGATPSNQALLDWLASEFVRTGWSIKELNRLIVNSRAYSQAADRPLEKGKLDPKNELISRMNLRRLDAEVIWDSMLSVSGSLDQKQFGSAVPLVTSSEGVVSPRQSGAGWRRFIYSQQVRKDLPSLLESFDLPQMTPNCIQREASIVPTQALHLLNDSTVRSVSSAFAARLIRETGDAKEQVQLAFRYALGRPPSEDESQDALTFRAELRKISNLDDKASLTRLCHALLNSAEFIYID
jgi:hypothetical protein